MVGREISQMYPKRLVKPKNNVVFEAKNFNVYNKFGRKVVDNVSINLRENEILGLFGLIGAGRSELVNSIYGSYKGKYVGEVYFKGEKIKINSPIDCIKHGIALLTEERKLYGTIPTMSVKDNISLLYLNQRKNKFFVDKYEELKEVSKLVEQLKIKTSNLEESITTLSGGNQQKVLLARNIMVLPEIIIIDEPTRGIDVGAKAEIYSLMNKLTQEGISFIMVSSELPEIIGISDRILVMHEGKITAEFDNINKNISQEEIMHYATGGN